MADFPDLPAGKGYPLVDTSTWEFGAAIEERLLAKFVTYGDSGFVQPSPMEAIIDFTVFGSHERSGPNSAGWQHTHGTDKGGMGVRFISHKNGSSADRLIQNPGAGVGFYGTGYALTPLELTEFFAGSGGRRDMLKLGQGFNNGVTTAGSDIFDSATAAFTVADEGAQLLQLTTRALNDPTGSIPDNTVILEYISPTRVRMSKNAGFSATGLLFRVGGRVPASTQKMYQLLDTDGITALVDFTPGNISLKMPVTVQRAGANPAFQASQAGDSVQRWAALGSGELRWSSGSAAIDTVLKRHAAGVLRTDADFYIGKNLLMVGAGVGGGAGVLGILNASVIPSTNPTGGGIAYAEGGALKWRGSAGTITTIAPA